MSPRLPSHITLPNTGRRLLIRQIEQGDEAPLAHFYAGLGKASRRFYHPYKQPNLARMAGVVADSLAGQQWGLVAVNEAGEVVGHGFLWGADTCQPELGLGITDAYQGEGLGSRFMELLTRHARNAHYERLRLSVYEANARARHLYEEYGFRQVGRQVVARWPWLGMPRLMVALHMELLLDGGKG